jgi:parvulin-like peptidyl-prolyl isomerase
MPSLLQGAADRRAAGRTAAHPSSRPRALLALGAVAGLACAVAGLFAHDAGGMPADAVALVNGEPVARQTFERALAALAGDRRNPMSEEDRRHVLERLVDEELLVQRGLELGLARYDRRVRGDIVSAVVQSVAADGMIEAPSHVELERFYDEHRDYFTTAGRVRVRQILVAVDTDRGPTAARARAEEARTRLLAGEAFERVEEALGDPPVVPLPDDLLPPAKLRDYIGPTALRTVLELAPGAVSEPVRSAAGYHVFELTTREAPVVPPLAEIDAEVRAEFVRQAGDQALGRYLEMLRARADVRVAEDLMDAALDAREAP